MIKPLYRYILILTIATISSNAQDISLKHYHANYKSTYESIALTPTEDMGLSSISILYDMSPFWYAGVDIYGATSGNRGGFFTTGVDIGLRLKPFDHIEINPGIFVGAGGGGAAPQGGGLMIRPYLEASYHTDSFTAGIGISHIEFPNGDISSTQPYFSISIPTDGGYISGHPYGKPNAIDGHTSTKEVDFSFLVEHYVPRDGSLNTDGVTQTKPYTLAGVKLKQEIAPSWYSIAETAGAGGGSSDGFMEILAGVGYQYKSTSLPIELNLEALLGAAGGGRVDTGGGIVYKLQAGATISPIKHLSISVNAGTIESIDGTLSATTYSLNIGYKNNFIDTLGDDTETTQSPWSVRIMNKSYLDTDTIFNSTKNFDRVDLLGFSIERYITPHIYLIGQTYWAYKGGAGGYAEGVVGLGYQTSSYHGLSIYGEAMAGVGGGGGVDIGGGLFGAVGAGLAYSIADDIDIFIGGEYAKGRDGGFSSNAFKAGLKYNFSLLEVADD